jgi:GNAT superfamily N-acetyltransferase
MDWEAWMFSALWLGLGQRGVGATGGKTFFQRWTNHPMGNRMNAEDASILNGLVLLAIIIVVLVLLARKFFNSKRWKDSEQGKLKKAPVVVEVIFLPVFIIAVFISIGWGPEGIALALFIALSFRIVLVMIYDKFNPDWETDGTEVGVPLLEEAVDFLDRYDPEKLLNRMIANTEKRWEKLGRSVTIQPSDAADLQAILELYGHASALQREKEMVTWPEIPPSLIKQEIAEQRQWKMIIDNQIACIWVIAFDDPLIWGEKNKDPAVYIHRIANAPDFRGQGLVEFVVKAVDDMACKMRLDFMRLDTVGQNPGLIKHYTGHGFQYLGAYTLPSTEGLPGHYNDGPVLLFEREVNWRRFVDMTREELLELTNKELKAMLKERGLSSSGKKSVLVDRLLEASEHRNGN